MVFSYDIVVRVFIVLGRIAGFKWMGISVVAFNEPPIRRCLFNLNLYHPLTEGVSTIVKFNVYKEKLMLDVYIDSNVFFNYEYDVRSLKFLPEICLNTYSIEAGRRWLKSLKYVPTKNSKNSSSNLTWPKRCSLNVPIFPILKVIKTCKIYS